MGLGFLGRGMNEGGDYPRKKDVIIVPHLPLASCGTGGREMRQKVLRVTFETNREDYRGASVIGETRCQLARWAFLAADLETKPLTLVQ